jgi:hypothetical protein
MFAMQITGATLGAAFGTTIGKMSVIMSDRSNLPASVLPVSGSPREASISYVADTRSCGLRKTAPPRRCRLRIVAVAQQSYSDSHEH